MNEESKNIQEEQSEEIPEELYAPLGDVSFQKPKKEIIPEYVSYKDVDLEYSKKPFNAKKLVYRIVTLLIIALFVVASVLYVKNKKNVYRSWLNGETKNITAKLSTVLENKFIHLSKSSPFVTSFLVNFETDYDTTLITKEEKELLDTVKNIHMSYTLGMDLKNKELTHALKSTYSNEDLLTIYGNGNQDVFSLLIREVTGRYMEVPNHASFLLQDTKTTKKDIETFRKYMVQFLLNEIAEDELNEEKKELELDGKIGNVRDISLHLTQNRIQNILIKWSDTFKNNKLFKEKITSYFNISETDVHNYLEKIKNMPVQEIEIHVYAKGLINKVVGYDIKVETSSIYEFSNRKGKRKQYKLVKNGETIFDIVKKEENITGKIGSNSVEFTKTDENAYTYSIQRDEEYYKGTIVKKDTELKLSKQGNIDFLVHHLDKEEREISHSKLSFTYNTKTVDFLSKYDDNQHISYKDLKEEEKIEVKKRIKQKKTVRQVLDNVKKYRKKMWK